MLPIPAKGLCGFKIIPYCLHYLYIFFSIMAPHGKKPAAYDCTICGIPLSKHGPQINDFTFGRLFTTLEPSPEEEALLLSEFPELQAIREKRARENQVGRIVYDCNKIMVTPCGHLFHSGCLREWYFTIRGRKHKKCPFCNQIAPPGECILAFPIQSHDDGTGSSSDEARARKKKSDASRGIRGDIKSCGTNTPQNFPEIQGTQNPMNLASFRNLDDSTKMIFWISIFLFLLFCCIFFGKYAYKTFFKVSEVKTNWLEVSPMFFGYFFAFSVVINGVCSFLSDFYRATK